MIRIISKTQNGKIFKCDNCNAFHIEFKNLNFNFNDSQFRLFKNSIQNIEGEEWEKINEKSTYTRKILIPSGQKGFNILFNSSELNEFKNLLARRSQPSFILAKAFSVDFSNISLLN